LDALLDLLADFLQVHFLRKVFRDASLYIDQAMAKFSSPISLPRNTV
jgi:hypothetical protein